MSVVHIAICGRLEDGKIAADSNPCPGALMRHSPRGLLNLHSLFCLLLVVSLVVVTDAAVADGVRITGVAVKEDGTAVAGAEVNLLRRGQNVGAAPRVAKTDNNGAFAFDGVSAADYRIWG